MQTVFFWIILVRSIVQFYDLKPEMRPKPPKSSKQESDENSFQLSPKQQSQIKEVFELFDTDGGNYIDRDELDAAM